MAAKDISTVSIHGTGTPLGDPIETGALGQALKRNRGDAGTVMMLSNKACFGHTEGTAGLSGGCQALPTLHVYTRTWQCSQSMTDPAPSTRWAQRVHCSQVRCGYTTRTPVLSRKVTKKAAFFVPCAMFRWSVTGLLMAAASLAASVAAPIMHLRNTNAYVVAALEDWRKSASLAAAVPLQMYPARSARGDAVGLAGTSSFGMSGVNAHLLIAPLGDGQNPSTPGPVLKLTRVRHWCSVAPHPLLQFAAAAAGELLVQSALSAAGLAYLLDHQVRRRGPAAFTKPGFSPVPLLTIHL